MKRITSKAFLKLASQLAIIDVRSPKEFDEGHIPGAINLPIFTNDERVVVGTLYKKQGRDAAVLKGLEFVGPKMADFAKQAMNLAVDKQLLVHCWRGGMRSESMSWLFEKVGLECMVLSGGYKGYRSFCLHRMEQIKHMTVLKGCTGSGKTEILRELAVMGEQMIDLEQLANHRGSSFGGIEQGLQPTTQQFQNDLYAQMSDFDLDKRVWVEGESKSIGRVHIPDTFWEVMRHAQVMEIVVPFDDRVKHLVHGYATHNADDMVAAISRLQKRLGGDLLKQILEVYAKGDYYATASLLLGYYDRTYQYSDSSYNATTQCVEASGGDANVNAQLLLDRCEG